MAQNIYDNPGFFQGYSQLRRSVEGLAGAPEWPVLRAMLPDMRGLRVVDLGCGFGWFCRWAAEQGAASATGYDLSANMIDRAKEMTPATGVSYEIADLETLELPKASFELAYSSLAFHYVYDFGRLARMIFQALMPSGGFVFSIEHPIYMAPARPGWVNCPDGRRIWALDGYAKEGRRVTDWLAPGVVKYHRTMATTLNALIDAGFSIRRINEWSPTPDQVAANPDLAQELDRPTFLLISATRK